MCFVSALQGLYVAMENDDHRRSIENWERKEEYEETTHTPGGRHSFSKVQFKNSSRVTSPLDTQTIHSSPTEGINSICKKTETDEH